MKIRLVSSVVGAASPTQHLSSFLVDGHVAIDAGAVGFMPSLDAQSAITHVFLTHAHIDHIASLPAFIENASPSDTPITVLARPDVLDALERHVFNDVIWPNLSRIAPDTVRFVGLAPGETVRVNELRVTPLDVDHVVPTCGYLVETDGAAALFTADTASTLAFQGVGDRTDLRAVCLEVSLPDRLGGLAAAAKHLTPKLVADEIRRLGGAPRVLAVHLKARYREEIERELLSLDRDGVEIMIPDREYHL